MSLCMCVCVCVCVCVCEIEIRVNHEFLNKSIRGEGWQRTRCDRVARARTPTHTHTHMCISISGCSQYCCINDALMLRGCMVRVCASNTFVVGVYFSGVCVRCVC